MIVSKSIVAFFVVFAFFPVQADSESIVPVEIQNSHQEQAKLFIHELDEILGDLTKRFPDNISDEEFDEIIFNSFSVFYEYITSTKPKAQIHAIIMYLEYCELIFKHGVITSKQLQLKDGETKEELFHQFLMSWEYMLSDALDPITESLYDVFMNISRKV